MTTKDVQALIESVLFNAAEDEDFRDAVDIDDSAEALEGAVVRSFGDAGLLTRDAGLVLRLKDGTEFQISIVQSR